MTKSEAVEKLLDTARAEIGYHEGANNDTKYSYDQKLAKLYSWSPTNQPWCDLFVDELFIICFGLEATSEMTYQPIGSGSAACSTSASYYRGAGAYYSTPEPGDQIFFYVSGGINHTGIVEKVEDGKVVTIEGNTSDMVARRTYALGSSSIAGYGRPKWSVVADMPKDSSGSPSSSGSSVQPSDPQPKPAPVQKREILRKGMKGTDVREMQEDLIKLGYGKYLEPDGADGDFGRNTKKAVQKFQEDHGLDDDGEVGPLTFEAIEKALNGKSGNVAASSSSKVNPKFKVGDVVMFTGNQHYRNQFIDKGYECTPGRAKVTLVSNDEKSKHPYHVVRVKGAGSSVYGWVDEKDLEPAVGGGGHTR